MTSGEWLKKSKIASWWFEFEDLEWPDPALEAKWKKRADTFKKEGVTAVISFGFHFRWDYVYIIDRVFCILARVAEICHERNLKFIDHHSVIFVHRARSIEDRWNIRKKNHHHVPFYPDDWSDLRYKGSVMKDWLQRSGKDGEIAYVPQYNSQSFCCNNPEFRKAYLGLLKQLTDRVPLDALMADDIWFGPDIYSCTCEHCQKKFLAYSGSKIPTYENKDFWGNVDNLLFQEWIKFRYESTTEMYSLIRNYLSPEILLWGCSSSCIANSFAKVGFNPQNYMKIWDAVAHEVYHLLEPGKDDEEIHSEMSGFASMAKQLGKPYVVIFYANKPSDLARWLDLIKRYDAVPWLCKKVRVENAVPEEELLNGNYLSWNPGQTLGEKEKIRIRFSQKVRDSLNSQQAEAYVEAYKRMCYDFVQKDYDVEVVFDGYVDLRNDFKVNEFMEIFPNSDGLTCSVRSFSSYMTTS